MARFYGHFAVLTLASFLMTAQPIYSQGFVEYFDDSAFNDRWYFSNYDQGRDSFLTSWRHQMITVELPVVDRVGNGALILSIAPSPQGSEKPFFGSEVQRDDGYHYGRYEVVMKPGKGSGIVSSFFTYTGPYFGDPHDEIDFEFLGKDTTGVWINSFADGQKMPGRFIELGFDASEEPHLYSFEWRRDSIKWFVDGEEIFSITSETHPIPTSPSKLFMNIWAGNANQANWIGVPTDETETQAEYFCVSYRTFTDLGLTCSDYLATGF